MEYTKSPGDIYDLFSLFAYHFNKKRYIEKYRIDDPSEYDKMIDDFTDGTEIDDKLNIFFCIGEKCSFMEEKFLDAHKYDYYHESCFTDICERIKSADLFTEVLRFYTKNKRISAKEVLTADYLYEILIKSDVPDRIGLQLMHFNFNRCAYKEILLKELTEKYELVKSYHNKKRKTIEKICEAVSDRSVRTRLFKAVSFNPPEDEAVCFSVSLLHEKLLTVLNGKNTYLLIGCGAPWFLDEVNSSIYGVNIDAISKALSENTRIELLNFIKSKGEITTTEIANTFSKGLTATYYHLNILSEAQALKYRNEGRTVYYSINSDFFNRYADLIRRFGCDKSTML